MARYGFIGSLPSRAVHASRDVVSGQNGALHVIRKGGPSTSFFSARRCGEVALMCALVSTSKAGKYLDISLRGMPMEIEAAARVFTDPEAYADEKRFPAACALLRRESPVTRVEVEGFDPFRAVTT